MKVRCSIYAGNTFSVSTWASDVFGRMCTCVGHGGAGDGYAGQGGAASDDGAGAEEAPMLVDLVTYEACQEVRQGGAEAALRVGS
jgi:hypothetical protein